jgi:lysophospholipase L1-like esterase
VPIKIPLGALLLLAAIAGARAEAPCSVPPELVRLEHPLSKFLAQFRAQRAVRIVAIGSSSTVGVGASLASSAYPARLDKELDARFPDHDFEVVNKGVNGELAEQMLQRFERDVIPLAPSLVIWQTGVNDAIRGVDIVQFHRTVRTGIEKLKAAGADVLLVGLQYYPRSLRIRAYKDYRDAMGEAAALTSVSVFRRFGIMSALIDSGRYQPEDLLAPDQFHLNDFTYGCLAHVLAEGLSQHLAPLTASKGK